MRLSDLLYNLLIVNHCAAHLLSNFETFCFVYHSKCCSGRCMWYETRAHMLPIYSSVIILNNSLNTMSLSTCFSLHI